MGLTDAQRKAVKTEGKPLFIQAGAGTGKTFTLTKRLAYGLSGESGPVISSIDNMLTITFTEKAAGELLGRVRAELRAQGLHEAALGIDGAWISTIHAMCRRILATHALDVGIDSGLAMLSEEESDEIFALALEQVMEAHGDDELLLSLLSTGRIDAFRTLVTDVAHKIASAPKGADSFDLGPEVGKQPSSVLREVIERIENTCRHLEELGIPEGKVSYALCMQELYKNEATLKDMLRGSGEDPLSWRELAIRFSGLKVKKGHIGGQFKEVVVDFEADFVEACDFAAAAAAREQLDMVVLLAREACEHHYALKQERFMTDMDDLLIGTYHLLREQPEIARVYAERFDSIMLDEFQDTDQLQVEIVKCFCDEALTTLTTVGDAQQSIYRFRGADLEVYRGMRAEMVGKGVSVDLDVNYRSHPDILDCVEEVFSKEGFFGKEFLKVSPGPKNIREFPWRNGEQPRVEVLFAAGHKGSTPNSKTSAFDLSCAKARAIASNFEELAHKGASYGDMAILLSSVKGKAIPYLRALRERGIPCVISGGSTFYTLAEVHYLVDFLRVLENRDDDEPMLELLASPFFRLPDDELLALSVIRKSELSHTPGDARGDRVSIFDALEYQASRVFEDQADPLLRAKAVLEEAIASVGSLPLSSIVLKATADSGWYTDLQTVGVEGMAVQANIELFCDQLDEFAKTHGAGIGAAAEHFRALCELADADAGAKGKPGAMVALDDAAVHIMTIHSSKGLEFPIVAVAEFEPGPTRYEKSMVLTEGSRTYLALPPFAGDKAGMSARGEKVESFEKASNVAEFSAYALHLNTQREYEERQRLLYVALTRACDLLFVAAGDGSFADTGKIASAFSADFFATLVPEGIPNADAVRTLPSGTRIGFHIIDVAYGGSEQSEEAMMLENRHYLPPMVGRPHLTARGLPTRDIHSYSSISHRDEEPVLAPRCLRKRMGAEETVSSVGSAFHLVAQFLAIGRPDTDAIERRTVAAIRRYSLDREGERRLRTALEAWQKSELFNTAWAYPERHAEYPFCLSVGETMLEGFIDLLCLDRQRDVAFVVDYKTGTSGKEDELQERYRLQASCYAYALLRGGLCEEVELVFVRPESELEEIRFVFTHSDIESLEEAILIG